MCVCLCVWVCVYVCGHMHIILSNFESNIRRKIFLQFLRLVAVSGSLLEKWVTVFWYWIFSTLVYPWVRLSSCVWVFLRYHFTIEILFELKAVDRHGTTSALKAHTRGHPHTVQDNCITKTKRITTKIWNFNFRNRERGKSVAHKHIHIDNQTSAHTQKIRYKTRSL